MRSPGHFSSLQPVEGERSMLLPGPAEATARIAVVIPCYQVEQSIAAVVASVPAGVWRIYCVDDCSRDGTLECIERLAGSAARVSVVRRERNGGVGAAFLKGMGAAMDDGAQIIVKLDGDGQMNGAFVLDFARPIALGQADFVKGNRFFDIERVVGMPFKRLLGNAGLSFFSKLSTGYWHLFDPTNGYLAIHADVARLIPVRKVHQRYFFESDLLFRLSILRAVVTELPLETVYRDEVSGLSEWRSLATFPFLHLRNFAKRIFYNYFIRGFSLGSVNLIVGICAVLFGITFGAARWIDSLETNEAATAGTVMVSALPIMIGIQLILNFLGQDIASTPQEPIHRKLAHKRTLATPAAARLDQKGNSRGVTDEDDQPPGH